MATSDPIKPENETTLDILGIGVSVWDCVLLVDSYPEPGSVVRAKQRTEGLGGGIAVAVATAARLGSKTAMLDSLGDDAAAEQIMASLVRSGVETRNLIRQSGHSSSVASIWSEIQSAERTIVYSPGTASDRLIWTDQMEPLVSQAKLLHLNGRHPDVCLRAIDVAKQHGIQVSFDGGAYRYREEILPMLRSAEIVIVAREFAEAYDRARNGVRTATSTTELVGNLMSSLDCELAAVTEGAAGSWLMQRGGECFHQPALETELAIDTTGCGDTYHGAFLHAHAAGQGIRDAALLAAEISSKNAQAMGAMAFTRPRLNGLRFTNP